MEKSVHFSDLSGEMIAHPDADLVEIIVIEHPESKWPVQLETKAEEIEQLEKLVVKNAVTIDVHMPDEEEPTRHILTVANFAKLAMGRPMAEVLAEARPAPRSKLGGAAINGANNNTDPKERWGLPKKGKTSPQEGLYVRENLEAVNKRRAELGHAPIDPANPDHARRYGFTTGEPEAQQLPI